MNNLQTTTTTIDADLTIEMMDSEECFTPLFDFIEDKRPTGCQKIELVQEYPYCGKHRFTFDVTFRIGTERDEDGCSPVWHSERMTVDAERTDTVFAVTYTFIGEILALIHD